MPRKLLTACCSYADPEVCFTAVATVMLHQNPDFVLLALKSSLEHVASKLAGDSPTRARFKRLSAKLEALLGALERADDGTNLPN